MKTLINIPIRLRVDAEALRVDGPLIEQLVSTAVEKVLARAAAALAKDGRQGERVFHPPDVQWGGPALHEATQQARSDLEARIRAAIEAQVAKHRPQPPAPAPARPVRPWFVVKAVYFHTTPRQLFKYRAEVKTRVDVVDPVELYAHLLDTRTRAVAWLVQVNQELPIKPLGDEVFQRFSTLEKLAPKKTVYGAYTWSDRVKKLLEDLDQDGVVRGAFPSLQKTREKRMEVRTEDADKVAYLKRGGQLLFAFMPLPAINLLATVRMEPVLQATLPLRELEALVGAFDFKLVFQAEWEHARAAYGDDPVSLQLEPFVVERPIPERSLGALFEARRRLTSDVRWVGRTLLLNQASLAPLTPSVQALLRPLGDVTTQAVPAPPPEGHTWQPGWRGVSVTPTFNISRERLEVASWHPWAVKHAALLSGYLKLGRYDRRDNVFRWLLRDWPGTVRYALLELLLQELERLGAHEAFLKLLRDEASFFVFNSRSLVRLLEQTRYAELSQRLGVVEALSKSTRRFRRHDFDVAGQQIRLWQNPDRVVRPNDVLAQHAYIFQEQFDALRPTAKTLERLAGPMKKRVGELMGQVLCEGKERTQEELLAQAMQEAADALDPPLGRSDFEEVSVWTSYRLVRLEQSDPHDPTTIRVHYKRVRKLNDGPWEDVSEVHVDEVEKFGLYLAAYEIKNMERGVHLIAAVTLLVMGGFLLAEAGAVGFMVRLGGGRVPVLLGIAAREAIYLYRVATGQEEFSLSGFLLNAFKGWLDAVGFRFGSLGGSVLGRLVTAGGVRLLMTGAAVRILTRALGVGVSFVVEQFITDVIVLVRCGTWQGSAKKYVEQLAFGFVVGLGFELALPFLGAVAKPVLERLIPVIRATPGKLEVAKLLLKELTPEQAALWLRTAMERVEFSLREVLDNPKFLQEMGEALRGKSRELLDALPEAMKALPATAKRAGGAVKREYQVAFFNDLFDLAKIELKGPALEGFERLLAAAGTRDVYATVRTLLRHKNAERFITSLRGFDENALKRLLESGELERIIGSDRVRGFVAERGEAGWKLLLDSFDSSAVKLEGLLKDLETLAPDVQAVVLDVLRTHGTTLPPALRGQAEALWRLGALERELLGKLDDAILTRLAALERATLEGMEGLSADAMKTLAAMDKKVLEALASQTAAGVERRAALAMLAHEPKLAPELIAWAVQTKLPLTPELATGLRRLGAGVDATKLAAVRKLMEADAARAGTLLDELGRGNEQLVKDLLHRGDLDLLLDATKATADEATQLASALSGSRPGVLTDLARVTGNVTLTTGQLLEVLRDVGSKKLGELVAARVAQPVQLVRIFRAQVASKPVGTEGVNLLHEALELQAQGRVVDLGDWVNFSTGLPTQAGRASDDIGRTLGELREAKHLVAENPGKVIRVGGDANAPLRPSKPTETAQSFDITVERPTPGGRPMVERSVEVGTIDEPVSTVVDLRKGLDHAIDKVLGRTAEGLPIPGKLQATVRFEFRNSKQLGGGGSVQIDALGNSTRTFPLKANKPEVKTNLLDDLLTELNSGKWPNTATLDIIRYVDKTGSIVAEFQKTSAGAWARIR
ncbi:hypothetical protein [Pyxidicoccus trucidator]|uniref:hypothetical protein n=1 Tax=Pyxidicoccus trucidator TaxID=2709662 RepID=UPI0013DAEBE0|nr:hypothetical protein [Pyxidicoccus trucidator]